MTSTRPIHPPRNNQRQRGAAIIIMALILMLGLITLFTFRMDRRGLELDADRKTAMALAQAKEALLGRAASDASHPGSLPCPDVDNSGDLQMGNDYGGGATCAAPLGWLPWKTLDTGDIWNDPTQRLWYLQSSQFMDLSSIGPAASINTTVSGTLSSAGQTNIVAIIISPGPLLPGQTRSATPPFSSTTDYAQYLEGYNTNTPAVFNALPQSSIYNDRIITISEKELFTVVTFHMAKDLASQNTAPYSSTNFSNLSKSSAWQNNNWDAAVDTLVTTVSVTPQVITLKFVNCAVKYTIMGSSVTRNPSAC